MWQYNLNQNRLSKSQSHIATDGQSVSPSSCRAPSGAYDHIVVTVWQLQSCLCGASSLTRGLVCLLSESSSAVICHNVKDIYILYVTHVNKRIHNICRPLSVQAQYSRLCPIPGSFRYNKIAILEVSLKVQHIQQALLLIQEMTYPQIYCSIVIWLKQPK
jgi:hypothetical protein